MNLDKQKYIYYGFILLSVVSLFFVINMGSIITADSKAYFGMWPYVAAGYPFFLRILHYLFGENYHLVAIGIQYVLVIGSIFIFITGFLMRFSLKKYQLWIIMILLFYPIFDSNLFVVNNITTEGVSYAMFLQLIYVSYFVYVKRELKKYALLLLLSVILITVRGQFKFIIPLFLFVELLIQYKLREFKMTAILVIILIPILTFAIDVSYHKVVQKKFFTTPFTWTTLVTSILFVTDESDVEYVKTDEAKTVFKLVHNEFRKKKIGYKDHKYFEETIDYNYVFYHYEYPTLCNQTVQKTVVEYYNRKHNNIIKAYIDTEKIHKQLFFDLFPHKFSKWSELAFQNFKSGIGGLSIALLFIVSVVLLLKWYLINGNTLILFYMFLLLILLVNRMLVSISVHSIIRYFFYTNWIPIFLLFLGLNAARFKIE